MVTPAFGRHIPFEGVYNFRDLGGYETADGRKVRRRTVFRCGEMQNMTEPDLLKARGELGIKTIVDLTGQDSIS